MNVDVTQQQKYKQGQRRLLKYRGSTYFKETEETACLISGT
jgi:hypothetical protein